MNSINAVTVTFTNPWLLLLIIPAVLLAFFPYFRLPKQRRRTRNRVVSLVLHMMILVLTVGVCSGMSFRSEKVSVKNDVIVVIDSSASVSASSEKMNSFLKNMLAETSADYRIGVVTFGFDNVYPVKLGKDVDKIFDEYVNAAQKPDSTATNIASALLQAKDAIKENPQDGRIILLTDGLETDGEALAVAKAVANGGTRIDTVFFAPTASDQEAKVVSVEVPSNVKVNELIRINVKVQSAKAGRAILTLYDNGQESVVKPVTLGGGQESFPFDFTFATSKLHELKVTLSADEDTIEQNNDYYAFVNIDSDTKILIVDGTGSEAAALSALLASDHSIDVVTIEETPKTLTDLRAYNEVILLNVSNTDLKKNDFDQMLSTFVKDYGGGLLTAGGDKAYNMSDMKDSLFESMLPVETTTEIKPLSVMFVIDASGSMKESVPGSNLNRIEIAKQGAIDCIDALKDSDYMGVIRFNVDAKIVKELTPATEKAALIEAIEDISTAQGTQYGAAIRLAGDRLTTFDKTALKHIIFITDGAPQDDKYRAAVEQLNTNITFSVIAVGNGSGINHTELEELAQIGRGQYHKSENGSDLADIMYQETSVAQGKFYNNVAFTPFIKSFASPVVQGISKLPELGGYYGSVKAKTGATVVLENKGDPIYADWNYGLGKVASFMSDLKGDWSKLYFSDTRGTKLLLNMAKSIVPSAPIKSYDIDTEFINQNFTTVLNVTTPTQSGETVKATVTSPSGATSTIDLTKQSTNYHSGTLTTKESGLYAVTIQKLSKNNVISERTTYFAFSYSAEYAGFANESKCFHFLEQLAADGGGSVLYTASGMFDKKAQTVTKIFDPTLMFLIFAIVLFLVDIAARKFKFKWIHEIIRDKKYGTVMPIL